MLCTRYGIGYVNEWIFFMEKEERKVQGLVTLRFGRMFYRFWGTSRIFWIDWPQTWIEFLKFKCHKVLKAQPLIAQKLSFYLPFHAVISNGFWLIAESGVSDPHQYEMKFFSTRETFSFFSGFYINLLFTDCVGLSNYYYCLFTSIKQDLVLR